VKLGQELGLGSVLKRLSKETENLQLAGRRWYRLLAEVNAAIRAQGLPYYLDPTVFLYRLDGDMRRHFQMRSYRVEALQRFQVQGVQLSTLEVKRLDTQGGDSPLLGFSRDRQPFAIIQLEESERFYRRLKEAAEEGSCGEARWPEAISGMRVCGENLGSWLGESASLLIAIVRRHELQHQIDGPHLPLSAAVLRRLSGYPSEFKKRVNRELSAYIAELSVEEVDPHLGLVQLLDFALNSAQGPLHHTALITLESLVRADCYGAGTQADPKAALRAFQELAALSPEALRAQAAQTWARLYGEPLPLVKM